MNNKKKNHKTLLFPLFHSFQIHRFDENFNKRKRANVFFVFCCCCLLLSFDRLKMQPIFDHQNFKFMKTRLHYFKTSNTSKQKTKQEQQQENTDASSLCKSQKNVCLSVRKDRERERKKHNCK